MITRPTYITTEGIHNLIEQAIKEDIGAGDFSTLSSIPEFMQHQARLLVKQDCILAGVEMAKEIFHYYDKSLKIDTFKQDGDKVKVGDVAFIVSGNARSILSMERLVLNIIQRMSGIATNTHEMVSLIADTNTKLLDTRKTTPNFRMCEKWAVHIGGGQNHRFGLFDMIMLKDNHVDYAGGITQAVVSTVKYLKNNNLNLKIEVETRNIREVKEALQTNSVDIIMLDNMSLEELREAIDLIDHKVLVEASGNITKETIRSIAETRVDYISSGSTIYAAPNIDLSLKAI